MRKRGAWRRFSSITDWIRMRPSRPLFIALIAFVLFLPCAGCQHHRSDFYPVGIYSVPGFNNLTTARQAGFNLVTGPAEESYLDAAHGVGLRVLASPNTSAGRSFEAMAARRAVATYDAHPALWAWYLVDEPDLHNIPPEQVAAAHRFLKRLPARKPTALVIYQGYAAIDYANIADITMVDRYPISWLPLANLPQHLRMARLALGKKKPLIAVIQAFDWRYYPNELRGEKNLRPPNYAELRCMTYAALAQRATGLFYYCFEGGAWKIPEHPDVWEALKKVVREVNDRSPLFQAKHVWWPFTHEFRDPATRFSATLESSITPARLRVKHGNAAVPSGEYILAVNNTERKLAYRLMLPGPQTGVVQVLGEDRTVPIIGRWIEDEFEAYAIHIYGPLPADALEKQFPKDRMETLPCGYPENGRVRLPPNPGIR